MTSLGWSLLEVLLPLDIWLRTDLHALPHALLWILCVAAIGALALAIVTVAASTSSSRVPSAGVRGLEGGPRGRGRERRGARRSAPPVGGAGPRAPALSSRL